MNENLVAFLTGKMSLDKIMELKFPLPDGTTERHVQFATALMSDPSATSKVEAAEKIKAFQPYDDLSYRIIAFLYTRAGLSGTAIFGRPNPDGYGFVTYLGIAVWALGQVKHKIDEDYRMYHKFACNFYSYNEAEKTTLLEKLKAAKEEERRTGKNTALVNLDHAIAHFQEWIEKITAIQSLSFDDKALESYIFCALLPAAFYDDEQKIAMLEKIKEKTDEDYHELAVSYRNRGVSHYNKTTADLASARDNFQESFKMMAAIKTLSSKDIALLAELFESWKAIYPHSSFGWSFCDCAERYFHLDLLKYYSYDSKTKDFMKDWNQLFYQMEEGVLPEAHILLPRMITLIELFLKVFNLVVKVGSVEDSNHQLKKSGQLIFVEQIEKLKKHPMLKSELFLDPSISPLMVAARHIQALNERVQQLETLVQTQAQQIALLMQAMPKSPAPSPLHPAERAPSLIPDIAPGWQQAGLFGADQGAAQAGSTRQPQITQEATPASTGQSLVWSLGLPGGYK